MVLDNLVQGVVVSQEIRALIKSGDWDINHDEAVEKRIQPASFDPTYEDFAFRVPHGFRPFKGMTVEESLRVLHKSDNKRYDISQGFDIFPGFSYLLKLKGRFRLPQGFWMKSSPKSTQGRLGNLIRLLADRVTDYDEVGSLDGNGKDLWALVEPIAFPLRIYPDISLNQLRIFCGTNYELDDNKLRREISMDDLVYIDDAPARLDQILISKGLFLRADLLGKKTEGLIGFKSKKSPDTIDLKKVRQLSWEDYFEPIISPEDGVLRINPNDALVLLSSLERVRTPSRLSMFLAEYAAQFGEFRSHAAGFVDPNFGYPKPENQGDVFGASVVLEIFTKERGVLKLRHGDNCAKAVYEEVRAIPDKLYGRDAGSSYQRQLGAWLPKPFALPDLTQLVRSVNKDRELIMAVSRDQLFGAEYFEGFKQASEIDYESRVKQDALFMKRGEAETNPQFKQPIAYVVIVNPETQKIFAYQRAVDPRNYGEQRLRGKWSIGVGGHVRNEDRKSQNPLLSSLERELNEEVELSLDHERRFVGYVNYDSDEVGTVHFGLVYVIKTTADVKAKDPELLSSKMMTVDELKSIAKDPSYKVETWTQILLENIDKIL